MASGGATNAFICSSTDFPSQVFTFNDAFSTNGVAYGGACTDQTGLDGNISATPRFVAAANGNYQLRPTSPAIDAGSNSAPDVPHLDFAGMLRVADGNGDGNAVIDLGAYELQ